MKTETCPVPSIIMSVDTLSKMQSCCTELHAVLYEITHKGWPEGNPYSNKTIKKALIALAAYNGRKNYLDAVD